MNVYGEIALKAVALFPMRENIEQAWADAAQTLASTESVRNKGCPKNAFLGLCRAGLVKGVVSEPTDKISKNGEYAVAAVALLKLDSAGAEQKKSVLWQKIVGTGKQHNSQLDVVLALWHAGLIVV